MDVTPDVPLAMQRRCLERVKNHWAEFRKRRSAHIGEQGIGKTVEVVARNIVQDLLTIPLDWTLNDLKFEVPCKTGRADIVVTSLGIPQLIIETKAPREFWWNRSHVDEALWQARRYGDELHVTQLAVSDGYLLYAVDVSNGEFCGRALVALEDPEPPKDLWWLSAMGIVKLRPDAPAPMPDFAVPTTAQPAEDSEDTSPSLLHPKYRRPAQCFAYVGNAADPKTWKLPYLYPNGAIDVARLPKAIQAMLTDYRGLRVKGIPEHSVPGVLVKLGRAVATLGKLPQQHPQTADAYQQLGSALVKCGRHNECVSAEHTGTI